MRRGLLVLVSGCVVAALAAASSRADTPPATIPAGVTIAGVPVGGLAADAAAAAVEVAFDQPLKLVYARTTILVAPSVLGATAQTDKAVAQALVAPENTAVPLGVSVQTDETASFVASREQVRPPGEELAALPPSPAPVALDRKGGAEAEPARGREDDRLHAPRR
jgi:hypothetical protein